MEILVESAQVVRWPFYGDDWFLHYQTSFSRARISAYRYTSGNHTTILLCGRSFSDNVKVLADEPYTITENGPLFRLSADLLKIKLSSQIVESHPDFFECEAGAATIAVRIPPAKNAVPPTDRYN